MVWTIVLGLLGGYAALGVSVFWLDVAWSAFFGIRAPAEPILGVVSVLLALAPWGVATLGYWAFARDRRMRSYRFAGGGLALLMAGLVMLFISFGADPL